MLRSSASVNRILEYYKSLARFLRGIFLSRRMVIKIVGTKGIGMKEIIIDKNITRLSGQKANLTILRNDAAATLKYIEWMSDETTCVNIEKNFVVIDTTYMPGWLKDNSIMRMGIVDKQTDTMIGYCHVDVRSNQGAVWISINIGEADFRNKGYGSDVVDVLLKFGFKELNAQSVHLDVLETNIPAIHLYLNKGFTVSGRYRCHHIHDGKYVDWLHMDILKEEYVYMVGKL